MIDRIPTTEILAAALVASKAPMWMVEKARAGEYDDYKNELTATPCMDLVRDLGTARLNDLRQRAIDGEFEAQKWESDEWAKNQANDPEIGPLIKAMGLGAKL